MANTIRIKRSTSTAAPSILSNAELAYSESSNKLFIGVGTGGVGGSATSIIAIGGTGAYTTLDTTQTISGDKTFTGSIDLSGSTLTLPSVGTAGTYYKVTTDAKGRVTSGSSALIAADIPDLSSTYLPTTGGTISSNLTISGNLTVSGTTTTVNSTTVDVADKNITLGNVGSPTDTTANGGGLTLKGATDKTFNWVSSTSAWTSSEHVDLASGKGYYINGTQVLNGTTLGSGVTGSSLTSVGTLASGVWQGTAIGTAYGGTGATTYSSGQLLIGNSSGGLTKATLTAGTGVTITNASGSITINSSGTNYSAGNGLTLTDTTFSTNLKANGGLVIESTALAVDLGASSITGTLAVGDGGTGATTLTGLLKGNGTSAFTAAVDGTDYLSPSATIDGGVF